MNEEELKDKGRCSNCGEKVKIVDWILKGMCNKCNSAFQKGELKERERIRDFIIEVKNSYEIKSRYGEKAVINICAYLEEQLQKEIGEEKKDE